MSGKVDLNTQSRFMSMATILKMYHFDYQKAEKFVKKLNMELEQKKVLNIKLYQDEFLLYSLKCQDYEAIKVELFPTFISFATMRPYHHVMMRYDDITLLEYTLIGPIRE